jgi:YidC/Oxa1 family membrane protein insertase
MSKEGKENASGEYKWIGISSKYFFVSIVADSMSNADLAINSFYVNDKYSKKNSNVNYGISYEKTADNNEVKYWFYAGPIQYKELNQENIKFEKILFPVIGWTNIFFWADSWFPLLAEFVLRFLLFLTSFVKDYGISIALITIISKVITYPMTHSSTKTMNKMKDVTPKANQLREKYKNNSKKMNEELMELYRKEGVNPLNPGCLPMFLQMPIFIALYVVLKKAIELRGASTFIIPWVKDLSKPETLFSLTKFFPDGLPWYGSSVALMPIVMAVITFFQNKMTIKDPNQKMMIYFMPIFMLVLFNNFPAGLVYYWTLSSGLTLIQQYFTTKYTTNNPTVIVEKKQVKNRYNGAK